MLAWAPLVYAVVPLPMTAAVGLVDLQGGSACWVSAAAVRGPWQLAQCLDLPGPLAPYCLLLEL